MQYKIEANRLIYEGNVIVGSVAWSDVSAKEELYKQGLIDNPNKTLNELKTEAIEKLTQEYNVVHQAYLSQYGEAEVESFKDKAKEAIAYMSDNSALTPYVSAMANGDEAMRVDLLTAIWAKVQYTAQSEGYIVGIRDGIKAATTVEELNAITWSLS